MNQISHTPALDNHSKKTLRKTINRTCRTALTCQLLLLAVLFVYIVYLFAHYDAFTNDTADRLILQHIDSSAWPYLLTLPLMLLPLYKLRGKQLLGKDITGVHQPMTASAFWQLLLCLLAAQFIFSLTFSIGEWIANQLGYTFTSALEQATDTSPSLSMFLYAAFLGPLFEELIFRGAILPALLPHGKTLAIVFSAVLFGIYHSNIFQGIFATLVGVVLAYTALQYSFRWAVLLHIFNNLIINEGLTRLSTILPVTAESTFWILLKLLWAIGAVILLFRHRHIIKQKLHANQSPKGTVLTVCTAPWFLFYLLINLLLAISMVEPLFIH